MVFGMSLATYTLVHVVISLLGIASGLIVLLGWIAGKQYEAWTKLFVLTTILTSVTGFGFPFEHLLPSHIVGTITLIVLAIALVAQYQFHGAGVWRRVYVICSTLALYLNVFVLVVQSFLKVPALHAMAPTQKEPPFLIAQLTVMVIFVVLGLLAVKKYRVGLATA
jgi:hypothetical protein